MNRGDLSVFSAEKKMVRNNGSDKRQRLISGASLVEALGVGATVSHSIGREENNSSAVVAEAGERQGDFLELSGPIGGKGFFSCNFGRQNGKKREHPEKGVQECQVTEQTVARWATGSGLAEKGQRADKMEWENVDGL